MIALFKELRREPPYGRIELSSDQEQWLRSHFHYMENRRIMAATGLSDGALHRFARQFGLVKSAAGLRAIKKHQAAHIKQLLTENGYYASLKGNISQACRDGFRAYQASDRYEHPLRIIRKRNPRKYKRLMAERSEARTALVRKEKAKDLFGLPRATKLHLPMRKYTKQQLCYRYAARLRGYLLPDKREGSGTRYVIYWDGTTRRGVRFEENLRKAGFIVTEKEYDG